MTTPDTHIPEWADEFDDKFLWRDQKHIRHNLYANTVKAFIHSTVQSELEALLQEVLMKRYAMLNQTKTEDVPLDMYSCVLERDIRTIAKSRGIDLTKSV